jgi:DNA/RNA-binding domain of Phe-tRNA-synthetase-like protein
VSVRLRVSETIWDAYPGLHLGVVVARGIDNSRSAPELTAMVREEQSRIREEYDPDTLTQAPFIQIWRQAYASFGAKPRKHASSVESLFRLTLKGVDLSPINPVVDAYNLVSLRFGVPAGGDDMDHVQGDISLVFAEGGEGFTPLNSESREAARPGEVIYRDDRDVLCRRWNWRECDRTKMTEVTRNVSLVVEALPPKGMEDVEGAQQALIGLIAAHCGGTFRSKILDRGLPEIEMDV